MNGAAITSRVQIASLDLFDGDNEAMHPSLIEKPFLTVADLHLIGKVICGVEDDDMTTAEVDRLIFLEDTFADYLSAAVDYDWRAKEALVP